VIATSAVQCYVWTEEKHNKFNTRIENIKNWWNNSPSRCKYWTVRSWPDNEEFGFLDCFCNSSRAAAHSTQYTAHSTWHMAVTLAMLADPAVFWLKLHHPNLFFFTLHYRVSCCAAIIDYLQKIKLIFCSKLCRLTHESKSDCDVTRSISTWQTRPVFDALWYKLVNITSHAIQQCFSFTILCVHLCTSYVPIWRNK